jgi:hypothetical protein
MGYSWDIPSGKHTKSDIENGHKNSGFTWIYPLKMLVYQRIILLL